MRPRFVRLLSCNAYISVVVCRYALGGGVCAFAGVASGA
jgi:cell division FtsZ-interacting protein ZapD